MVAKEKLTPEERIDARRVAEVLSILVLADSVIERLQKHFPGDQALVSYIDEMKDDPCKALEMVELLVEGADYVIDDAEVHAFYRRQLDEHRERVAGLDALLGPPE